MIKNLLKKFPILNLFKPLLHDPYRGYLELKINENFLVDNNKLDGAWKSKYIPEIQDEIVKKKLIDYKNGIPNNYFDDLISIICSNIVNLDKFKILEIGCSSGYFSEILKLKGINTKYVGCDYSAAFIDLAREKYPNIKFDVEDAINLSYESNSFEVVLSATCLLHIRNYVVAISEATRISNQYVIFYNTPVFSKESTKYFVKNAYGEDMIEIHFQESELIRLFSQNSLKIMDIRTHDFTYRKKYRDFLSRKTYLCEKLK